MFKSKIFNSVMRYMLVAMLALLPNTIWGLTEQNAVGLANGSSVTISNFSTYLTMNDYSAWFVYDAAGKTVDISSWTYGDYIFSSNSKEKTYFKTGKPKTLENYASFTINTPSSEDITKYTIVLLVSSSDAFFNAPSETNADKKIIFKLVPQKDVPLMKEYTGTNKMSVTDFVADGSTSYEISGLASSIESLLALPSSSDGNSFDLSSKKLYLRLNLVNKTTNKVVEAANYTVKRDGKEINTPTMTNWPNVDCKIDKGTFFYLTNNTSYITKDNIKYTFSVPDGQKISDYKIDVYLSDEATDVSNNTLLQEPTLKAKITYTLMPQSEKDKLTFDATDDSSLDASKVFDFRQAFTSKTAKVQLLTEENKQRLCEALGVTDLSKVTDLYVRWMITDKSGNAISGITASGLTPRKDKTTEKEIYYTWFSENAASTLSAALNPTFTFPTTMSWDDLKVSCVVSNTKLVEGTNVKYGVMIKEPDAFNIKFNVSLEEAPLLNDLDAAYSSNLKEKSKYISATHIAKKELQIVDIAAQLEDFNIFTKNADGNFEVTTSKPFYLRVSLLDKVTGEFISPQYYAAIKDDGSTSSYYHTSLQYGNTKIYKNSKGLFYIVNENAVIKPADLRLAIGFNDGDDMSKYRIEIVASDETPQIENYLVVTEPTIKGKLVYDIKSATDAPFKHYKGYANADYEVIDASNGQLRQKTYTWEYTYPVAEGESIPLTLPLEKYATEGNPLEPLGYFRWYNYDTDMASEHLQADNTTGESSLKRYQHVLTDEFGKSKGIFAYNMPENTNAWQGNVGVFYTRPNDTSWEGETIACDVSRYVDGIDETGTYMDHESTLSIRYIFHLIPAKQMADMEKNYLTHSDNDLTYEDNKNVTVGFANAMSTMTLRLNMKPTMYYFYPMINNKHHVYFPTRQTDRDIVETDFGQDLKQATKVIWRIYNGDKDRYFDSESNVDKFPRFFDVSQDLLNRTSNTWKDLDGNSVTGNITFNYGDHFSVVAYAVADDNSSCPIANFNCRFFAFHPMMDSEMSNEEVQRKISYLEENYTPVAIVSFDNDSPEQTLAVPTNDMDNQSEHPSDWSKRNYGFVYKNLMSKSATHKGSVSYYDPMHSPLHGEYGIYKTANMTGVSTNSDKYLWHHTGTELHDRTWELTGGSQTGSFLYVDASDESRTIASAEFNANLCTGQQMAFSAYVADMTDRETKPQLMFKLYGLVGNQKVLLHNFSSGDFGTNRDTQNKGEWYQVYGKITIQKESHAEQYDKFRIEIDNYSKGTQGADYAVDDIRIYLKPAKVEVFQDRPACSENGEGKVKLKIRAIHETLNAILNHQDTKIHFRFVEEDGTPVTGKGLYDYTLDGVKQTMSDGYASVDVYDSEAICKSHTIDGVNMIETDAYGETYIILANHQFGLKAGKKYYVSVCADSDPNASDAQWGKPSDVCSIYSDLFELVGQTPAIIDSKGNVITDYRVDCADPNPSVKLKGSLTTIDPKTGAKIMLTDVPFYWYINQKTTPYNSTASNEITIPVSDIKYGAHTIYMKPAPNGTNADGEDVYTTKDGVSYLLCDEAVPVPLRIAKDGPQLNFGFNDVIYPFNDATYKSTLRIGLPQIKKLLEQNETNSSQGYLQIPLHSASYKTGVEDKTLTFIDDSNTGADNTSAEVYVATTNDPLWNKTGATLLSAPVAKLKSTEIGEVGTATQATLDLLFLKDVLDNFHEGYYYDLRFVFEQKAAATGGTSCPGEAYLKLKIVPEFITWTPTADGGMNANWNNDVNWHRSSKEELYDDGYTNYLKYGNSMSGTPTSANDIPTLNSYVPMKFTKVTIGNLNGLPFPDLGNVVYRSTNQIATKLTNGKGNEATKYIQYDIMAFWNEADANKGLEAGNLKCEKFYGNTCHQIYFKPQGELRDQCYLVYDKAWVEKELEPNKWYTMASPLQYIYAGDMYVPAKDGRQETKAFTDITFDTNVYSRSKYPVYQRAWMKSDVKEITPNGEYPASHYLSVAAPGDVDMNLGYWSHVYNKVDESYAADGTFGGFSIKAGNALLPKDKTKKALLRLPKADTEYQYFDYKGNENSSSKTLVTKDPKGRGRLLVAFNNDEKHLAEKTQTLGDGNNSGFYLVANPYTCSISMAKFFEGNSGLKKAIWIVENGEVKATSTELDYKNYAIQPTQSFFVKKDDATVTDVRFTSTMCIDRTITPGLLMASDYVKSIEATTENSSGQTSKARIALRPEASADYDDQEDVDLLYDQNLKDIPQVYTVAGNEAVAVNAVPELSWIPLGIVSQQAEEVSLTLKGVNKLDAPVYLYDAASASFTEVHDGEAVKVKAGDHGRYFLTQTRTSTGIDRMEAEEQSALVKVYSPAAGMIVVSALGGEKLDRVQVFTLDGKMVHSYQLPAKQRMILRVPSGIYIVKASTQSCAQAKGQKISVR